MNTYRRSFVESNTFKSFGVAVLAFIAILWIFAEVSPMEIVKSICSHMLPAILIVCVFLFPLLFFGIIWTCFFIEMDDNYVLVRNFFFPFMRKKIMLDKISHCKIYFHAPAAVYYIQVKNKGCKKWGMFYGLDMVKKEDIGKILSFLENSGVIVSNMNIK